MSSKKYDFKKIESKWQKRWAKNKYEIWHVESGKDSESCKGDNVYVLDMFPYPSGEGLHVGHVEGYTASDIMARFLRMNGYNVLHPMGWDAFGLPAENYAIKKKIHPRKVVEQNIKRFRNQLKKLGFSYDWQREINTTDPNYYKWTQWIFLQLFKRGLAYKAEAPVNWCPSCSTVLANEEIIEGRCERCGDFVERRNLKQWMLKITAYADRLLDDLNELDWPEKVKEMQRNWIGRSEGRVMQFPIFDSQFVIDIFTTRPDTVDGATYVVLAPEHPLIVHLKDKIKNWNEVAGYIATAENKSERERIAEGYKKTGVELKGVKAVNPYNKEKIPVWVADYVLAHYGTGAIMAVPAHDERDREFAETFNLPIKDAPLIPEEKWLGEKKVNYKLRDWVFSRQRYWGEPIPLVFCESCKNRVEGYKSVTQGVAQTKNKHKKYDFSIGEQLNPGWIAVPEEDLPVKLPEVKNYQPTGRPESPLAGISRWVNVKCPKCGGPAKRETNTMPQWAGSNWYYLAYIVHKNSKFELMNKKALQQWLPVDIYIGGVEHAVLHLLYARFWHKFLYDIGIVPTKEPFQKLINQGLILGSDNQKMSKSRGNVINPDEMVEKFGADSLRLYEMFMGPLEDVKPWQPDGIVGLHRFLTRVYKLINKNKDQTDRFDYEVEKMMHKTIKKVTQDIKEFKFNTAISAMMIFVSYAEKKVITSDQLAHFAKILFPFAPHLAQEMWEKTGGKTLLDKEQWPEWNESLTREEVFDLIIQINGKTRGKVKAKYGISEDDAKNLALNNEKVKKYLNDKNIKHIVFVKNKLINIVVD